MTFGLFIPYNTEPALNWVQSRFSYYNDGNVVKGCDFNLLSISLSLPRFHHIMFMYGLWSRHLATNVSIVEMKKS